MNFRMIKIKLALFGISVGAVALGLGQCIGDILGDAWILRTVD